MDFVKWTHELEEKARLSPPEMADEARRALACLRFPFKADELVSTVEKLTADWQNLDESCRKLDLLSFYDPADRQTRSFFGALCDQRLFFLTSYAPFFKGLSESARAIRLLEEKKSGWPGQAARLASVYAKPLLPLFREEEGLVLAYMESLEDMSLSGTGPANLVGEARRLLQSMSRDRRRRAYQSFRKRMSEKKADLEAIAFQIHQVRRALAEKAGYGSFYDYELARTGQEGEDRSDIKDFRLLVQKHLAPLTGPIRRLQWERLALQDPKPWDVLYPANFGLPVLDPEALPLEEVLSRSLPLIFSPKESPLESLLEKEGLQIKVRAVPGYEGFYPCTGMGGGPSGVRGTYIPSEDRSFLVLAESPQELLVRSLFSEIGYLLYDRALARTGSSFLLSAEEARGFQVARQSMVYLSQRVWQHFYGKLARYAREYDLTMQTLDLPLYCALDEMGEFLARARVTNLTVFRHAWNEIAIRYGLAGTQADQPDLVPVEDLWLYSPSLWIRPLTGIFHAMATVSALATLPFGRRHQKLEEAFRRLVGQEGPEDSLDRLAYAGYPSPFEEETFMKAAFAIVDFLAL